MAESLAMKTPERQLLQAGRRARVRGPRRALGFSHGQGTTTRSTRGTRGGVPPGHGLMAHDCPRDGTPAFGLSCCYGHLKDRLREGASLTSEERVFVGIYPERSPTDGWRQPAGATFELDALLSIEDTETLRALMTVGDDPIRVEFLS